MTVTQSPSREDTGAPIKLLPEVALIAVKANPQGLDLGQITAERPCDFSFFFFDVSCFGLKRYLNFDFYSRMYL